jgi:hypothetical protein
MILIQLTNGCISFPKMRFNHSPKFQKSNMGGQENNSSNNYSHNQLLTKIIHPTRVYNLCFEFIVTVVRHSNFQTLSRHRLHQLQNKMSANLIKKSVTVGKIIKSDVEIACEVAIETSDWTRPIHIAQARGLL